MEIITDAAPRSNFRCRFILTETWTGGLLHDRSSWSGRLPVDTGEKKTLYFRFIRTHIQVHFGHVSVLYFYLFKILCTEKAAVPWDRVHTSTVPRANRYGIRYIYNHTAVNSSSVPRQVQDTAQLSKKKKTIINSVSKQKRQQR